MKWHLARSAQYFGTGDIEGPKPSIRQVEEAKGEEIAQLIFEGKLKTPKQIEDLARSLDLKPEQIPWLKLSPKVQNALEILVKAYALEKMPKIIEAQAQLGETEVKSAEYVAKVAEVIKPGSGVTVNTAVGVDNSRRGGDSEQQVAFIERMRDRQLVTLQRKLSNGSDPEVGG